jgi:hypothetical protein
MRFKGQADNQSRLTLPRRRVYLSIAFACAAAFAVAGCKNAAGVFEDQNDGGWFSKPFVAKPDWARVSTGNVSLGPQGPVGPEDMVSADGQCAAPAAALAQSAEANTTEAAAAGGAPSATQAAAAPNSGLQRLESTSAPLVTGGIALGMTECQAVQRAGTPSNVAISTGDKGERKVVLTYLSGPRPGIYTFSGGRLNVVELAPEQPKSAKPAAKKTPKKKPANTAQFQQAQ